jgi:hypothetical protein
MNKLLTGLATVPLMTSVAFAGHLLTDRQMDTVTAGQIDVGPFTAVSTSEAESYGGQTAANTTNLAEVAVLRLAPGGPPVTVTYDSTTLFLIKSVSAASSISTAQNIPALESP